MNQRQKRFVKGVDWDVFTCVGSMDGDYQIQKVDESASFISDMDAINYVIRQARKGDEECIDALWQVLDSDALVVRQMEELCNS